MKYKIFGNPYIVKVTQELLRGKSIQNEDLSTIPEHFQEIFLEPDFGYAVLDHRVRLVASFFCDDHSVIQIHYSQLPPHVLEAALADIEHQGGGINHEGFYRITSPIVKEYLETESYQEWLKKEAKKRGIKIIEEEIGFEI
jgi:hypothetical protein